MFRLLELLGGLSVSFRLGSGSPLEESLRRCPAPARLARAVGSSEADVSDVLYTALLQHLGCTAYAHELAEVWGDDVTATRQAFLTESAGPRELWRGWVGEMAAATGRPRIGVLATTLRTAQRMAARGPAATCEVAQRASSALGLPDVVQSGLGHMFAQWNGKGYPAVAGNSIPLTARIMAVASVAVLFRLHADRDAAITEVGRRSGHQLDPELAGALVNRAGDLLGDLEDIDAYAAVLDVEPDPIRRIDAPELRQVARTFGHLVDLKSPWLHGHSAAVADLAAAGGLAVGLPADGVDTLLIAGHLHDLGRTAIPSGIWDKSGPLSAAERDQARLHAYYSERVLSRVPALIEVARLAGQHHERCDGSGYHRGSPGRPAQHVVPDPRLRGRVPQPGRRAAAPTRTVHARGGRAARSRSPRRCPRR